MRSRRALSNSLTERLEARQVTISAMGELRDPGFQG